MIRARKGKDTAPVGVELGHWAAPDALHDKTYATEHEHSVLGLAFLKKISEAFKAKHAAQAQRACPDPEDLHECSAACTFWVPMETCRAYGVSRVGHAWAQLDH